MIKVCKKTDAALVGALVLLGLQHAVAQTPATSPTPASAEACGRLEALRGSVEILRVQSGSGTDTIRYLVVAKPGISILCNDVIQTGPGGGAKLALGEDKITMAPDSRIEVSSFSKPKGQPRVDLLQLSYGKMRAVVKNRGESEKAAKEKAADSAQGRFRVKTFSAVVGVRGTDLFTSFDPNASQTEQAVIEGKVEVTQAGSNETVVVESGQQVSVPVEGKTLTAETDAAAAVDPNKVAVKTLKVVPIQDSVRQDMRVASAVAKEDPTFTKPAAVTILGKPQTWTIEREPVPENLRKLKNEF